MAKLYNFVGKREIKFRAFVDGKMIYPTNALSNLNRFFRLVREDAVLMEYTGFEDKNGEGNNVYEGDLFKNYSRKEYGFVAMKKGQWVVIFVEYEYPLAEFLSNDKKRKVEGNIYENSELIEVG